MQVDNQTEILLKNLGMKPLSIETGVEAFTKGLSLRESQVVVVEGVQEKIEIAWGIRKREPAIESFRSTTEQSAEAPMTAGADRKILTLIRDELSQIVMELLKLEATDFTQNAVLTDLGFDSIGLTTYANEINKRYQTSITPVLFYEHSTIKDIAKCLLDEHKTEVLRFHNTPSASISQVAKVRSAQPPTKTERVEKFYEASSGFRKKYAQIGFSQEEREASKDSISLKDRFVNEPIAIVGMSGVMPQSENLEEFWENLRNAKDMVTLIPKDRWNWEDYFGDPIKEDNKSNSKWGGFMKDVDKFDAPFFGISPKEAVMMDPQQRIFLQTVWKAIEDSFLICLVQKRDYLWGLP
jgi:acyl carrier protein